MNKLLILCTTTSQITTNSTNYYQLTNYYVDKTKLLFSHRKLLFGTFHSTRVLYTFFSNNYYLIIKLLFWKQKRTIGSYTNKKVLLSRDSPFFFPAFLFFNETFFPKLTRTAWHGFSYRNYSTVVFASWRGSCVVKGMEWLCIQFVKCNTGVILSQSTSTWQPLCARYVLPVGWLLATLYSVNVSSHSSHGWYIIAISRCLSLRVLVFFNPSLMTFQWFTGFAVTRYIVSISLTSTDQRFLSAA